MWTGLPRRNPRPVYQHTRMCDQVSNVGARNRQCVIDCMVRRVAEETRCESAGQHRHDEHPRCLADPRSPSHASCRRSSLRSAAVLARRPLLSARSRRDCRAPDRDAATTPGASVRPQHVPPPTHAHPSTTPCLGCTPASDM